MADVPEVPEVQEPSGSSVLTDGTRELTLRATDLDVTYRVYEDRRPRLREVVAGRGHRPNVREIKAVRGVSLEAYEGEAIGVIGHNGSGKSSLLRTLAGLMPPTAGEVFAVEQPILMGVSAALRPAASGRRNILLGGLALGLTSDEIRDQIPEIIEFTGLEDFIDLPIRTYSSGMRARLYFAIGTMIRPRILLVDEALAVGDDEFRARSKERVDELLAEAGTVFLISHSRTAIGTICNRCIWMHGGRLRADGEPEEILDQYQRYTRKQQRRRRSS